MPLYKTITPNPKTIIKIWKITESYSDLMQHTSLKPDSLERVLGMKSDIHRRGFLSIRYLLASFNYKDTDLFYNEHGKPLLKDGKHISITHSFEFSAVIVSDTPVGIDIEKRRDKITSIASKFIGYESNYLDSNASDYVNKLTVTWCIKESLYKLFSTPGLSFKQHCLVIPFEMRDKHTTAWIDYDDFKLRYNAFFLELEDFTCGYTL